MLFEFRFLNNMKEIKISKILLRHFCLRARLYMSAKFRVAECFVLSAPFEGDGRTDGRTDRHEFSIRIYTRRR